MKSGPASRRAVFLVGFMGAGKTTVGRELSKRLNWRFVDLDDWIVSKAGRSIPQIFQLEGEAAFREREANALRDVLGAATRGRGMVIALGGGTFVQPNNYEVIRGSGIPSVFLDAKIDTLLERCRNEQRVRPLAQDENQFRQLYEARRSSYMRAEHRVESGEKSVAQIVNEIVVAVGME